MSRNNKFNQEQKQLITDLYCLSGYSITKIINSCDFKISRESIYSILKDNNVTFTRKKGLKHNLIGKTFGYLTVINIAQTEKSGKLHAWRAICKCNNCGNEYFDVNPQSLLRGQTTSCGCSKDRYIKTTGSKNKQYKGCGELNGKYWGTIKTRAERRNYKIEISIEYAWNLYLQQNKKCALSGLPINFAISNKKSSETTASLDRIDSTKGYVEDNVQWVHKHVNIMKNVFEQKYFISLCKLITENNDRN